MKLKEVIVESIHELQHELGVRYVDYSALYMRVQEKWTSASVSAQVRQTIQYHCKTFPNYRGEEMFEVMKFNSGRVSNCVTSETTIRKELAKILIEEGPLNTTQIKEILKIKLNDNLFPADLLISFTRQNETMFMQRVGNVVSHRGNPLNYRYFIYDSSVFPTLISLTQKGKELVSETSSF